MSRGQTRYKADAVRHSKLFRRYIHQVLTELDGRCCYCQSVLYTDREIPYLYPDWIYEENPELPRSFIDRNWHYHVDHIVPISKGGSIALSNLVPACARCNSKKGNRLDFPGVDRAKQIATRISLTL